MNKDSETTNFILKIGKKAKRKTKARNDPERVWFGLGMMGLIGWSVVVPTLLGAALGTWLDKSYSDSHSWTLVFLVAGLCIGCLNVWRWMSKQHHDMQDELDDANE